MMPGPDLDDLYRALPAEFVAARDAKATELRQAGDKEEAAAVKALRRPSLSAWLANWLAHDRSEDLDRLLDLGAALRQAQEHLEADDLRQLSRQRQQVVSALVGQAYAAGLDAGLHVTDQATRELQSTLVAALADEEAAEQVRAGRLSVALSSSGFGPGPVAPVARARNPNKKKAGENKAADEARVAEEAKAAEEAREAADAEVKAATVKVQEHESRVAELEARRDQLAISLKELQQQVAAAGADLDQARQHEAAARTARDTLS